MNLGAFDEGGCQVLLQARQAALSAHDVQIGSGHLLLACLDHAPLSELLAHHGLDIDGTRAALPRAAADRELLAAIGIDIDPAAVRERVRAVLGNEPSSLRLHRRRSRPLEIVFDGEGRRMRFNAGARKVLEVATWRAKGSPRPDWRLRQHRSATATDLLAGILSDARDPVCRLLIEHGGHVRRSLFVEVFGRRRT